MIKKIKTFLDNANQRNVKLYFVERSKSKDTKQINYNIFKTIISTEIGEELINSAIKQITTVLNSNPEYNDYGILPYSDSPQVEKISKNEVPFLSLLIEQVSLPNHDIFDNTNTNKIFGYIVKIEIENKTLFLFRKYTPKKLLEKGKIPLVFRNGSFQKINYQIMSIDEKYDAVLLLVEGEDTSLSQVFILNRPKFESMFSFVDYYEKEVESKMDEISDKDILDDIIIFREYCKNDSRIIKKLARILRNGEYSKFDSKNIRNIVNDFGLEIKFDGNNKMIVTKDNIWSILRILDDDNLKSDITNAKYEARSKVKK